MDSHFINVLFFFSTRTVHARQINLHIDRQIPLPLPHRNARLSQDEMLLDHSADRFRWSEVTEVGFLLLKFH